MLKIFPIWPVVLEQANQTRWTDVCSPNCSVGWTVCSSYWPRGPQVMVSVFSFLHSNTDCERAFPLSGYCIQSVVRASGRTCSKRPFNASHAMSLIHQRRWCTRVWDVSLEPTCSISKIPCLDVRTICIASAVAISVNTWLLHFIIC